MKLTCLTIATVFSVLSTGFAEENSIELRLNFDYEMLSLTPEGIFLSTDPFGEIHLSNVHLDEKGYYSMWEAAFICINCKRRLESFDKPCEDCGSEKIGIIRIDNDKNDDFTSKAILFKVVTAQKNEANSKFLAARRSPFTPPGYGQVPEVFNKLSRLGGDSLLGTMLDYSAKADNDGNKSITARVYDTVKDENGNDVGEYGVKGQVTQGEDGKTKASIEVGGKLKF